jgi:hypothetical protein
MLALRSAAVAMTAAVMAVIMVMGVVMFVVVVMMMVTADVIVMDMHGRSSLYFFFIIPVGADSVKTFISLEISPGRACDGRKNKV